MNQLIPFNPTAGGKTPNFCLANVCAGFGIPNKYASAWQAWENTEQHTDAIPDGLDVPVFFSYTATIDGVNQNWGHIGVRLASGQFWSDGNIYDSIDEYLVNHWPKYVGWGESINDVKIIGDDMSDIADHDFVADVCVLATNLQPETNQVFMNNIGVDKSQVVKNFLNYSEHTNLMLRAGAYDELQAKIAELESKLNQPAPAPAPEAPVVAPEVPAPQPVPATPKLSFWSRIWKALIG